MPRQKPKEPLRRIDMRISDKHRAMLRELGGVVWLRKMLEKHAKMPKKYYDNLVKDEDDNRNRELKTSTTTQGARVG
jgi:hypothetical protein